MRIEGRVSALIELLDKILAGIEGQGLPADAIVSSYFRTRRYAGSKDRRFITTHLYGLLRDLGRLQALSRGTKTARSIVIAYGASEPEILDGFTGAGDHAPEAISDEEQAMLDAIPAATLSDFERLNLPEWLQPIFEQRFGDKWQDEVAALNRKATLDIRVNPLKLKPKALLGKMVSAGYKVDKMQLSTLGLRLDQPVQLVNEPLYMDGSIEVQDEAAQVACMLVDVKPGEKVVDLCAGAGGKSLLLSAFMENKGELLAFDINKRRLSELHKRAERAGVKIIESQLVPAEGSLRADALELGVNADKVIVDAPCSGTGTWRRNPDQRWRLTEEDLKSLQDTQVKLLSEAADLVRTGGDIFYMTCSLLEAENEAVVNRVCAERGDLKAVNLTAVEIGQAKGNCLQLTPAQNGTDGFFVARLQKVAV